MVAAEGGNRFTAFPSLSRALELPLEGSRLLGEIEERRARFAAITGSAGDELEEDSRTALVESCESSNRLEGITASRERIEGIVHGGEDPLTLAEREIAGYRDALRLVHESAGHMDFTVNIVIQLHATMHRRAGHTGGRWKNVDNRIEERAPDGSLRRVRFEPVSARETPLAIERLAAAYLDASKRGLAAPLVLIPCVIFDFLAIHPFADGNGRVSRLLTNTLLHHAGHGIVRFVSIERIIENTKKEYYGSLEAASPGWHEHVHDIGPWIEYCWSMMIEAYRRFERFLA